MYWETDLLSINSAFERYREVQARILEPNLGRSVAIHAKSQ
jgi:hypothetical protein